MKFGLSTVMGLCLLFMQVQASTPGDTEGGDPGENGTPTPAPAESVSTTPTDPQMESTSESTTPTHGDVHTSAPDVTTGSITTETDIADPQTESTPESTAPTQGGVHTSAPDVTTGSITTETDIAPSTLVTTPELTSTAMMTTDMTTELTTPPSPVPGPVENLTAEAVNSTTLEVLWIDSGNGTVREYKVWAMPSSDSSSQYNGSVTPDDKKSYRKLLSGLTPGEVYTVTVSSTTDEGHNVKERNDQSVEAKTMLAAPCNVTAIDSNGAIDVSWDKPDGTYTNFKVTCHPNAAGDDIEVLVNETSGTCDEITAGALYEVSVLTVKEGFEMENCSNDCCTYKLVTKPMPPINLKATARDGAVELTWNKPSSGSWTGYRIMYGVAPDMNEMEDVEEAMYTVLGLAGDTEYEFQVQTIASHEEIDRVSDPEKATAITYSAPVTDVSVEPGNRLLSISWDRPANNVEDTISNYVIYALDGAKCVADVVLNVTGRQAQSVDPRHDCDERLTVAINSSASATYNLSTGIVPCKTYSIEIEVINDAGSTPGPPTNATALPDEPWSPVGDLTADNITSTGLTVTWTRPEESEHCNISYLVNYTYPNCSDTSTSISKVIEGLHEPRADLEDLQPNWSYTVQVLAFTARQEDGDWSQEVIGITSPDGPKTGPATLSAVPVNDTTMNVTWSKPDPCHVNGDLTGYRLSYSCHPVEDENTGCMSNPPNSSDVVVRKITHDPNVTEVILNVNPAHVCEFAVVAFNEEGESPSRKHNVTANTGQRVPQKVANLTSEPDARSVDVWWTVKDEDYVGPTDYNVSISRTLDPSDVIETYIVEGFCNRTWRFEGLVPFVNYSLSVVAIAAHAGPMTRQSFLTKQTAPPAVQNFTANHDSQLTNCLKLSLSWDGIVGDARNGLITEYEIEMKSDRTDTNIINVDVTNEDENNYSEEVDILAESELTLTIRAKTEGGGYGEANDPIVKEIPTCGIGLYEGESEEETNIVQDIEIGRKEFTEQFSIRIKENFFTWAQAGVVIDKGLIVKRQDVLDVHKLSVFLNQREFNSSYGTTWATAKKYSFDEIYRATEWHWKPDSGSTRKKRSVGDGYVNQMIGEDGECKGRENEFCNGYLLPGLDYKVKAFVCNNAGCRVTAWSTQTFTTSPANDGLTTIIIAVSVVLSLVVLLLVAAIVWKMRFHNKPTTTTRGHSTGNDNYGMDHTELQPRKPSLFSLCSFRCSPARTPARPPPIKPRLTVSAPLAVDCSETHRLLPQSSAPFVISKRSYTGPVMLDRFQEHVAEMHRDSDLNFSEQYRLLKEMSPQPSKTHAEAPENRTKNRFTNILSFDHSRVKLLPVDDDEGTDYINANYVPGYNSKREFIAAQGPLPATKDDFWRMIWEQNTNLIVMLTRCVERGRPKCDPYWPNDQGEPIYYGDLQVILESESVIGNYTIRRFTLSLGDKDRSIKQLHFTAWPDHGCPESTEHLLTFVQTVRECIAPKSPNQGATLIHCSAGVGRTGTLIAVDRLLQHIRDHNEIDIFGTVLEMRNYRCNMVQTEDQYIYIHDCIRNAIQAGLHLNPQDRLRAEALAETGETESYLYEPVSPGPLATKTEFELEPPEAITAPNGHTMKENAV